MRIEIRKKATKRGGFSLYLDIYHNGVRRYEFLKMYLVPENSPHDKMQNKETMRVAETIRAQRLIDLERGGMNLSTNSKDSTTVVEWLVLECDRKRRTNANLLLQYIIPLARRYFGQMKLHCLTREAMLKFREYVSALPVKNNTRSIYFSLFKCAISQAIKQDKIPAAVLFQVKQIPMQETHRCFLTMDEMKTLAATDCPNKEIKRAFLFSCLTGLRLVDVSKLKWANVSEVGGYTRLTFVQQKTGGHEYMDISTQAVSLLGERGAADDRIFSIRTHSSNTNVVLKKWVQAAGIDKPITFHSARHSFAVMLLELGVDITVIQKLLGHRNLATTMIYAKVLDKSKRAAVTLIPQLL